MLHPTHARVVFLAAVTAIATNAARGDDITIQNGYHAQETSFYCGPSSMQMMLDCPVVKANNAAAAALTQNQLYAASRPNNFLNIQGTDPVGFAKTMDAVDGTKTATGRGYAWWGFVPTVYGGYYASRTVANTLKDYSVPATIAVGNGAHWVDVNGVKTTGVIGRNTNYTIQGFRVKDPWTGYWQSLAPNQRRGLPSGLGKNSYFRYGFDDRSNGTTRPGLWFNFFNPVNPAPAPYGGQYVVEVEPQGPELPDDGNGGAYTSLPAPIIEGSEISKATAYADAMSDLAADSDLNSLPGFENGGFDSAASDEMLFQSPGDQANEGDFLIPYDGAGGVDDITGAVLIDASTGVIDAATWLDPTDTPYDRADIDQLFLDTTSDLLPQDDFGTQTPEPATLSLLIPGLLLFQRRRAD